jgi:hypothetical protein
MSQEESTQIRESQEGSSQEGSTQEITEEYLDKKLAEGQVWLSSGTFNTQCTDSQFEEWRHSVSQDS